ncbi:pilin [Candidatus Gracilibacteria bacterium]|nr:pilin [Candidatus Gracilibacteria bacterium]MCF7856496.1 pilin [Candidatus Gracilibacteria bacterium]MCF7896792.1 pilin [Candidatus Gracilibacteria bacterium]
MLRKIILGIVAFIFVSTGVQAGVGILEASEQAGFTISCPEGAANCSAASQEMEDYSISGTQNFVLRLLGGILNFAAIIAVLMLVIVGARLVIAMGNQEGLQAAKKQLLWTFGGLAVIILSLLVVRNITEKIYEAAQDCLSVAENGIYSEKTEQAQGEASLLATSWCVGKWNSDGKTFDENIFGFQKEFNQLVCGGADSNWIRVDAASAEGGCEGEEEEEPCEPAPTSMDIPESCYEGDLEAQSKIPGCEALANLIPICGAMDIVEANCSVMNVQYKLGAWILEEGDGSSPSYYDDPDAACARADGLYGQCTKKALDNYFKENSCADFEWTEEEQ